MPKTKNIAAIHVTHLWLEVALQIPDGNRITRVIQEFNDEQTMCFKVVVEGPNMPEVSEGELMQTIVPKLHKQTIDVNEGVRVEYNKIVYPNGKE